MRVDIMDEESYGIDRKETSNEKRRSKLRWYLRRVINRRTQWGYNQEMRSGRRDRAACEGLRGGLIATEFSFLGSTVQALGS